MFSDQFHEETLSVRERNMKLLLEAVMCIIPGPFRRFSTRVWQNARVNTVRRAMVCDVYSPFPKIL